MTADKIWAVSSGSYSDYRVLACVATEADAVKLATRINETGSWCRDAFVESFPLVAPDIPQVQFLTMSCNVMDDGSCVTQPEHIIVEWPFDGDYPAVKWRWVRTHNKGGRLDASGTDHGRVRRVFSDRRAQLLAEDAFRMRREAKGQR